MTDITELVKRLRAPELWARHGRDGYWSDGTPFEAADALEAQAKEIAELKKELNAWHESANWPEKSPGRMRARIAELEAALNDAADMLDNAYADIGRREYQVSARAARAALKGEKWKRFLTNAGEALKEEKK